MPNKSEDAMLAWQTMKREEARTYLFVILTKCPEWAAGKSFFGDDPASAANFMWGRVEVNYQLFVRGREYKWAAERGEHHLIKHLEYCLQFDQTFFKDPELDFPKGETFITKKDLSSAEE